LDIVKTIEKTIVRLNPVTIFTHFAGDLNIDHGLTYRAVITATRPLPYKSVKQIFSFEVPSSTEWNFPVSFAPDAYFDISTTLATKEKALQAYVAELRNYPHPRSIGGVRINASHWGMGIGVKYAEAFKIVRLLI
jgi:LmbE family N-acetylglucosaminyl deacetylase